MEDILKEVRTILYTNPALLTLLGGKRVYKNKAPKGNDIPFPRIILYEITTTDTDYADDNSQAIDYTVQVSIFSKKEGETLAIFNVIDPIMKANDWRRTFSNELYEEDEQVFNRPLRYRQKFMNE